MGGVSHGRSLLLQFFRSYVFPNYLTCIFKHLNVNAVAIHEIRFFVGAMFTTVIKSLFQANKANMVYIRFCDAAVGVFSLEEIKYD